MSKIAMAALPQTRPFLAGGWGRQTRPFLAGGWARAQRGRPGGHALRFAVGALLLAGTHAVCSDQRSCGSCLTRGSLDDGCFWCVGV